MKKLLLVLIFSIALFAGYTQDRSFTTVGDNNYTASEDILRLDSTIDGNNLTLKVSKVDDSDFRTSGDIYFQVGTYEAHGVDRHTERVDAGEYSKSFTHDMNTITEGYPKEFYGRYESDETNSDGSRKWVWVGPITITRHLPTAPNINVTTSAVLNQESNITVQKGTISDGKSLKIQCTASASNYTDASPFKSSYSSGGDDVEVSFTFAQSGEQTIWCSTFDETGLSSAATETKIMVVGEKTTGGLERWFTPYRCFGTTAPELELHIESDTNDSVGNRLLELEFYTSGGTQSCVDSWGETRQLAFGARWRADGLEFEDLTPASSETQYKRVRVTIPDGNATEIRLAVITTLGKLMTKSIIIDANGNITSSSTTTYGLNGSKITDQSIISTIKDAIIELEDIKNGVNDLSLFSSDALLQQYDGLKQRLDGAKAKMDAISQAIDDSTLSDSEKTALKAKADEIKSAIDDIKAQVDGYKDSVDNSSSALESIKSSIDRVIAMMRNENLPSTSITLKAGRNTISGTIDVRKLDEAIHSIWIVDGGNWWGYSPHSDIRTAIESKYLLIEDTVRNYKGALVYAISDTSIESADPSDPVTVTHEYGRGYTLHGTDGVGVGVYDIECTEPNKLIMVAKVRGDVPSIYVPDQTINGIENIDYLYENDGYYVLCDKE